MEHERKALRTGAGSELAKVSGKTMRTFSESPYTWYVRNTIDMTLFSGNGIPFYCTSAIGTRSKSVGDVRSRRKNVLATGALVIHRHTSSPGLVFSRVFLSRHLRNGLLRRT